MKDWATTLRVTVLASLTITSIVLGISTGESSPRVAQEEKTTSDPSQDQVLRQLEELRNMILKKGYRLRVYVPYGRQWYEYSIRRLKENPKMAGVVIKALFRKG